MSVLISGIKSKIKETFGFTKQENVEQPPQNLEEVIDGLPEKFHDMINKELPYRRLAAFTFIILVLGVGFPIWYYTTVTERFPFETFPAHQPITFEIKITTAYSDDSISSELELFKDELVPRLNKAEVVKPLALQWKVNNAGKLSVEDVKRDSNVNLDSNLEVKIFFIPTKDWPHFSATNVHMTKGHWTLFQWKADEDKEKRLNRLEELIREVLVDVPHLNVIVKRDLRQRMEPWQIATLPLSHQKRLVWDSAPLAMHYIIQIVHVHDNAKPSEYSNFQTEKVLKKLADKLSGITTLEVTSEHLWDFGISTFLEKDVQDRWTLSNDALERVIKEVDSQSQSIESAYPLLKIAILETAEPLIMLDYYSEDSRGAAIAAWGSVIPRSSQTESRVLASLRVLLGVDAELGAGWTRDSVPLASWEISRMRLRATLDNAMRGISAVATLKVLEQEITTILINKDVASKASGAVQLITKGLESANSPSLSLVKEGRLLADEAISHPTLLSILYFPQDQTFAVYVPILLPILIPLLSSSYHIFNWIVLDPLRKTLKKAFLPVMTIFVGVVAFVLNGHLRERFQLEGANATNHP